MEIEDMKELVAGEPIVIGGFRLVKLKVGDVIITSEADDKQVRLCYGRICIGRTADKGGIVISSSNSPAFTKIDVLRDALDLLEKDLAKPEVKVVERKKPICQDEAGFACMLEQGLEDVPPCPITPSDLIGERLPGDPL